MNRIAQLYQCAVCTAMVEVVRPGPGTLVCCNRPMVLLEENTVDASREKQVPVLEKDAGGIKVKVGSIAHPMTEEHLIEWIEVSREGEAHRTFLHASDAPEAVFAIPADGVSARIFCNLHGLWKA